MLRFIISLSILALLLATCMQSDRKAREMRLPRPVHFDLDSIVKRGKIILLTENSATSYYLYRGQARGFDYEMARLFAKHLGVKLEVKLLDDVDRMFDMLNRGEGDLIATNLTITPWRQKHFAFSLPLHKTRQVLVQRVANDSLKTLNITDTAHLAGKTIWVHRYSSFFEKLTELNQKLKNTITIREAPGELSTDDLIRLCASGEIEYTVTDENLALIQQNDYPNLNFGFAITQNEDICWAMRSNSMELLQSLNKWLTSNRTQLALEKTRNKYFEVSGRINYQPVFVMPKLSGDRISVYDSLFKKMAPEAGWDWRLLAALVYQESRFNPEARSWSGAFGLMQLMPETAMKFGCDTTQLVEANIKAGVRYIKYLDRMWRDRIRNPEERLKFVLASYNIGPGHVIDAQCIAARTGLSDTLWYNHVAECMLLKTQEKFYSLDCVKHGYCYGKEPYNFVQKILSVYEFYKSTGIR